MNPQGHRPPGGGQQPGRPGGNPNGGHTPFDQQVTQQANTFSRPQQPPPGGGGPQQSYSGGPQYAPVPPAAIPTPPPAAPQPPEGGWKQQLQDKQWWIAGAVAAVAAAVVATVTMTGQDSGDDAAPTAATTSVAQVPAGPTTTVPAEPSAQTTATAAPTPSGSPAPPPPPPAPTGPTLAPDALAGLLLPPAEIDKQLNISGSASVSAPESQPLGGSVEPPHCTGAWGPAYAATYDGTGFTGMIIDVVALGQENRIAQSALAFPDSAAAQRIFDKLLADWNACANTHATFSAQGAGTEIDIKAPRRIGDVHVLGLVPTTSPVPGQQCERGMALRGNVIVDVRACSPTIGSGGLAITAAIADKIR